MAKQKHDSGRKKLDKRRAQKTSQSKSGGRGSGGKGEGKGKRR